MKNTILRKNLLFFVLFIVTMHLVYPQDKGHLEPTVRGNSASGTNALPIIIYYTPIFIRYI